MTPVSSSLALAVPRVLLGLWLVCYGVVSRPCMTRTLHGPCSIVALGAIAGCDRDVAPASNETVLLDTLPIPAADAMLAPVLARLERGVLGMHPTRAQRQIVPL